MTKEFEEEEVAKVFLLLHFYCIRYVSMSVHVYAYVCLCQRPFLFFIFYKLLLSMTLLLSQCQGETLPTLCFDTLCFDTLC